MNTLVLKELKKNLVTGDINDLGYFEWAKFYSGEFVYIIHFEDSILRKYEVKDETNPIRIVKPVANKGGIRSTFRVSVGDYNTKLVIIDHILIAMLLIPNFLDMKIAGLPVEVNHKAECTDLFALSRYESITYLWWMMQYHGFDYVQDQYLGEGSNEVMRKVFDCARKLTCNFTRNPVFPRCSHARNLEICTKEENVMHDKIARAFGLENVILSVDTAKEIKRLSSIGEDWISVVGNLEVIDNMLMF